MRGLRKILAAGFIVGTLLGPLIAPAQTYNLMPQPAKVVVVSGRLTVNSSFRVALMGFREPRLLAASTRLIRRLSQQTGISLSENVGNDADGATLLLHCDHAGEAVQSVSEDESYRLDVAVEGARITAPTPSGILRGMETFLQLVEATAQGFSAPGVSIDDSPRFPWRGLMIDVCRHWMPLDVLKRNLDAMSAVKLNVLHLHLSDDQGFRLESKRFPKLQEQGSDGHYFTQVQIAELVAYARDRGIRIVPELDMPGHSTSWVVGYPELASGAGPYHIERRWGIFDPTLDPTREETYAFLDGLIGEIAGLFPDEYFHVGGDEVNGKQWDTNPQIVAFKLAHGMKDNAALQSYFHRRLLAIVQRHGKKMIGWGEVFQPDRHQDIVVQSWQGPESLAQAARLGFKSILSHGYYLDLASSTANYYQVDPLAGSAAGLTPNQTALILGGEACMWGEFVTPENIDSRIWPSAAAIAERLWSRPDVKDLDSMYRRLDVVSGELERQGATHRSGYLPMLARLAGRNSPATLRILADVVTPATAYAREQTREYSSLTPLDRLVDAARPESEAARKFGKLVDGLPAHQDEVRKQLIRWRDSRSELLPILRKSPILEEDIPLAEDLSAVARAGLEALDYLESGRSAPQAWVEEQNVLLTLAAKPHAELLLMIVDPVHQLVERAQRGSWRIGKGGNE